MIEKHITKPNNLMTDITVREYFAAMAMQGLLSVPLGQDEYADDPISLSIKFADELIVALNGGVDD